ncbi:MAG: hypothetical protein IPL05_05420 [Betaproteobacteria bacterium]|nr:hypothetical protein [Betaproteobacteria bacterium]
MRRADLDAAVHVFLFENECTLQRLPSGQPRWQRGFRGAKASMRGSRKIWRQAFSTTAWQTWHAIDRP